ncbi:RNA polymerase sigma factor [Chloroflexi bacterium TSY]|nr:RNA polymerase sigma factor [Chloroflexi bacterium TSY]
MNAIHTEHVNTFESLVANERTNLLRFCTHLTGSVQAAEDLTQETLLTAWRRRDIVTDVDGLPHWLKAIARNVCRHWHRSRMRQSKHLFTSDQHDSQGPDREFDMVDDFDLDAELEHCELVTLLDRAMAQLPPETRSLLVQHYIEERPHAEIATQSGLSTSAVGVRLHRGKQALRQALVTDFRDDAISYGLVRARDADWVETRMWCFRCGQHQLQARFTPAENRLCLRCPGCCDIHDEDSRLSDSHIDGLQKIKAFKPAFSRVLDFVHTIYFEQAEAGRTTCPQCGHSTPLRYGPLPERFGSHDAVYVLCDRCEDGTLDSWHYLALSLPQVRQFWRKHPRMAELPDRQVEIANSPAVLTGFESVTDGTKIEVAFSTNTFEVIDIN